MKNWLSQNWFKISTLLVILIIAGGYFFLKSQELSNNKAVVDTVQPSEHIELPEQDVEIIKEEVAPAPTPTPKDNEQTSQNTQTKTKVDITPHSEGYISANNGIVGWAFDDNKPYTVKLVFMNIDDPSITFTTSSNSSKNGFSGSWGWASRSDAASQLIDKGISVTSTVKGFSFSANGYADTDPSVPRGRYVLIGATYNGKSFSVAKNTYTTIQSVCGANHTGFDCLSL